MQLPDDQRSEVNKKASAAMEKINDSMNYVNELISNNCATMCGYPKLTKDSAAHDNERAPEGKVSNTFWISISPRHEMDAIGVNSNVPNLNTNTQDLVVSKANEPLAVRQTSFHLPTTDPSGAPS